MNKLKTYKQVTDNIHTNLKNILTLTNKKVIQQSFERIECIITGQCICDSCNEWDSNILIIFELGRCLISSKILQLIKHRHVSSKRWLYIEPLYNKLFLQLYNDILPNTGDIASISEEQPFKCTFAIDDSTILQTLDLYRLESQNRLKKLR